MRITAVCIIAFILMVFACGEVDTTPEEVTLSSNAKIGDFPNTVVAFGDAAWFEVSDFNLSREGGNIIGTAMLDVISSDAGDYLLLLSLESNDIFTLTYIETDFDETFITPSGSLGDVCMGSGGFDLEDGKISFSMLLTVYGVYDLHEVSGTARLFCLPLNINETDGSYQAVSNVVATDFVF